MAISAVILLRINRLRAVGFSETLIQMLAHKGPGTKWPNGDQRVLNEFMLQHQDLSYRVDGSWNCVASRFKVPQKGCPLPANCSGRPCGILHVNEHMAGKWLAKLSKTREQLEDPGLLLEYEIASLSLP